MTEYPYDVMPTVNNDTARRKIANILKHQDLLENEFQILDHGYITLLDWLGEDLDIALAAWVSTEGAVSKKSPLPDFLDYLMRHKHSGPFEMCELKFRVKVPLFVARQWLRHRTASVNEVSGRYTKLPTDSYMPAAWRLGRQGHNKQSSSGRLPYRQQEAATRALAEAVRSAMTAYGELEVMGVAPEQARLTDNLARYTTFVWKTNLKNLMHFLLLRTHSDAQEETRAFAEAVERVADALYPLAMAAWRNHVKHAVTFSQDEQAILRDLLQQAVVADASFAQAAQRAVASSGLRPSRQMELLAKLEGLMT